MRTHPAGQHPSGRAKPWLFLGVTVAVAAVVVAVWGPRTLARGPRRARSVQEV